MTSPQPFRKRRNSDVRVGDPFALEMRKVQRMTHHGSAEEAWKRLADLELAEAVPSVRLARIYAAKGHLHEVAEDFEAAAGWSFESWKVARESGDRHYWIGPAINEILNWLRLGRKERALNCAEILINHVDTDLSDFAAEGKRAENLPVGASLPLPQQPDPMGIVMARIGSAFHELCYLEEAAPFYAEAIKLAPGKACRARQRYAEILLAWEDYPQAERLARESIVLGSYQSKTIGSWDTYFAARDFQDKPLLEPELRVGLFAHSIPSVRARGVLEVAKRLRLRGDEVWEQVANQWLDQHAEDDPVVATELVKLKLAEEKSVGNNETNVADYALWIFRDHRSSPSELFVAGKDVFGVKLRTERNLQIEELIGRIARGSGRTSDYVRYSFARSAYKAGEYAVSESILNDLLEKSRSRALGFRPHLLSATVHFSQSQSPKAFETIKQVLGEPNLPIFLRGSLFKRGFLALPKEVPGVEEQFIETLKGFLEEIAASPNVTPEAAGAVRSLRTIRLPREAGLLVHDVVQRQGAVLGQILAANSDWKMRRDSLESLARASLAAQNLVHQAITQPMVFPKIIENSRSYSRFLVVGMIQEAANSTSALPVVDRVELLRRTGSKHLALFFGTAARISLNAGRGDDFVNFALMQSKLSPGSIHGLECEYWYALYLMSRGGAGRDSVLKRFSAIFRAAGVNTQNPRTLQILVRSRIALGKPPDVFTGSHNVNEITFRDSQKGLLDNDFELISKIL